MCDALGNRASGEKGNSIYIETLEWDCNWNLCVAVCAIGCDFKVLSWGSFIDAIGLRDLLRILVCEYGTEHKEMRGKGANELP